MKKRYLKPATKLVSLEQGCPLASTSIKIQQAKTSSALSREADSFSWDDEEEEEESMWK